MFELMISDMTYYLARMVIASRVSQRTISCFNILTLWHYIDSRQQFPVQKYFPFFEDKKKKTRKKNGIKVLNFEWPSILKNHEDSYSLILTWFLPSCQVSLFPRPTLAIVLVSLFYRSDVENKRHTISGRHELDKTNNQFSLKKPTNPSCVML